jgi:SPP1 family predicted phage head-tail adaptor
MRAGLLRERVTIEQRVEVQSASGAVTWTWEPFCANVPARVQHLRGALRFQAAQLGRGQSVLVTVRYMPGVRTTMRLAWNPECSGDVQYLEIGNTMQSEDRRELQLDCWLRSDDGYRNEK